MNPHLKDLLDHISLVGRELSPDRVDALAHNVAQLDGASGLAPAAGATQATVALVSRLKELWSALPDVDGDGLGLALMASQRAAEAVTRSEVVELLWTGPTTHSVPVRRTDQALYELIESAEQGLLVVSFAAYKVPRVLEALERALHREVSVRFVLESGEESGGKVTFDPVLAFGALAGRVEVYGWPRDKRPPDDKGRRGTLHAKCAVADDALALISSANLTEFALGLNMELGVLIRGGRIPKTIAEHFEKLITDRVLDRAE